MFLKPFLFSTSNFVSKLRDKLGEPGQTGFTEPHTAANPGSVRLQQNLQSLSSKELNLQNFIGQDSGSSALGSGR